MHKRLLGDEMRRRLQFSLPPVVTIAGGFAVRWEAELGKLQASQLGLVTWAQLRTAGMSEEAIRRWTNDGLLRRVRRGVYASPAVEASFEQELLAAVLAAGLHAFGSHLSAARMWGAECARLIALLEITTLLERQPRLAGVKMHRSGLLVDPDVTLLRGVWVTTPERTLCDLSSRLDESVLGKTIDDMLRRRLTTYSRIWHLAQRLPSAPGRSQQKMLKVLLARGPEAGMRESDLEDFVHDALRRFHIPLPVPQHRIVLKGRTRRIDHCYPERKLAIEAKGYEYHGMRSRFDDDALRGNELELAHFRLLEFTSAFDDWTIASQVAEALELPIPHRPHDVLTYAEWSRRRDSFVQLPRPQAG